MQELLHWQMNKLSTMAMSRLESDVANIRVSIAEIKEHIRNKSSNEEAMKKRMDEIEFKHNERITELEKFRWKQAGVAGISGAGVTGLAWIVQSFAF